MSARVSPRAERVGVAERAVRRSLAPRESRNAGEVRALVEAGERVLRRSGFAGATVGDILEEAGLSSRAFYRHFPSKDELMLAVFERDSEQATRRQRERLAGVGAPRAQLEVWIEDVLSLGYDPRRARRTRLFLRQSAHLEERFPQELAAISMATTAPLHDVLERGRRDGAFPGARPGADAASIFAVAWGLVRERLAGGGPPDLASARAQALRFCLPVLEAIP